MKKIIFFTWILLAGNANAQAPFIVSGRIEFEKQLNIHKETGNNHFLDGVKDKRPKFRTSLHNLYFRDGKTLFEKGKDVYVKIPLMSDDNSVDDIIYSDLTQGVFTKKQNVFDETFLISDSIRHIKWKMTNDLRDIAGFECHKAVAVILDSVFVVAYYTDQIPVAGGPLAFCNLPGMILGVAIPRFNLTLFATKVELLEPKPEKMLAPAGRKKTDYKGLNQNPAKIADRLGKLWKEIYP